MEKLKEKKTITKPTAYNDLELRVRIEELESQLEIEKARLDKVYGRLGMY